jgi:hypothetical protein
MDVNLISSALLSAFVVATTYALFVYLRGRIALDPRSALSQHIIVRFASPEELAHFHEQHVQAVLVLANAALAVYARELQVALAEKRPSEAAAYPPPPPGFRSLSEVQTVAAPLLALPFNPERNSVE